jgi:hypothetical protein
MSQYGVAIFRTTSSVMQGEKALLRASVEIKLIPTPRRFSSDCGISIRFRWDETERVKKVLEESDVKFDRIYLMAPNG